MKDLSRIILVLAFNILALAAFSGCSKEDPEAKKVNVAAMTEALKSADKDTRVNACIELGKAGPRATPAMPALIPLLKDPDPLIRKLAAYDLGQIGPNAQAALPTLREMLNDSDLSVFNAVASALQKIDPKNASSVKKMTSDRP